LLPAQDLAEALAIREADGSSQCLFQVGEEYAACRLEGDNPAPERIPLNLVKADAEEHFDGIAQLEALEKRKRLQIEDDRFPGALCAIIQQELAGWVPSDSGKENETSMVVEASNQSLALAVVEQIDFAQNFVKRFRRKIGENGYLSALLAQRWTGCGRSRTTLDAEKHGDNDQNCKYG
jgi:hypothetical protein